MTVRESWLRCPFPALSVLFVLIILISGIVMVLIPGLVPVGLPPLGALVATLAVGLTIEMLRRKSTNCPWLEFEKGSRAILYIALFVVGLFVVFPGVWPTLDVAWPLRLPFAVFAIPLVALLRIHKTVDHSELEEVGVRRGLYFASRLPVFLLGAIAAFLTLAFVFELVGGRR